MRGGVWAWGVSAGPTPEQLPLPRGSLTSLVSTDGSLFAATSRGAVVEWRDVDAQLASGRGAPQPAPLGGPLAKVRATSLAAGAEHLLVITDKGESPFGSGVTRLVTARRC